MDMYVYIFISMITFQIPMLCAVGCILRMPGSPMILCACIVLQGEDPYLGIVLNTKETLPDFFF